MTKRNFSMEAYWNKKAEHWQPLLSFEHSKFSSWEEWQQEAKSKLWELLGDLPEKVDLNAEIESSEEVGDLIRERVVFDTEEFMSIPCYVLRPKEMPADRSQAAILCCHGHPAPLGKDPVAGLNSTPELVDQIEKMNYNYGEQMAREGFLTIVPDLRGFGERRDGQKPFPGRDACNVNFIKGAILGQYMLGLNIWDMMRCVDYLQTRPEVDPDRIGMMGLSLGGTMTTFTTALDERIKAADIIGYVNPWLEFAIKRANFCGVQMLPEIYKYFETHDIAGLIAPRPLLIEMGTNDRCFFIQDLQEGFKGTANIYRAAQAEDNLWEETGPSGHAYLGGKAPAFFKQYL